MIPIAIVATGYVRLQVLSNALANDIKKSVQSALKDVDADMKKAGKKTGETVAEGVGEGIDDNKKEVDTPAENLGERIQENVIRGAERGFGSKLKGVFSRAFRSGASDVESEIEDAGKKAEASAKGQLKKLQGSLKQIASGSVQAIVGFIKGAIVYAMPSLVSTAGGAIASVLATVIPAANYLGAAGASGVAVFGSALLSLVTSAGLLSFALKNSGDTMKEASKKAEDIKEYLGTAIAETFAPGAERALDKIREALPFIHDDLNELGAAWGRVAEGMADTLTRADNMGRISSILKTNNGFLDKFGIALGHLTTSFLILYDAAKPFIDYVGDGLVKFSEWVETTLAAKEASGELSDTVDRMLARWKQLWETIKDFGKGIFNIFKAASPVAGKFGDALSGIAEKFRAWTDKPENMKRMTDFFEKMWDLAQPIAGLIGDIGRELGHWLENLDTEPIKNAIATIRDTILPAVVSILTQVTDALGPEFQTTFENIATVIKGIADSGIIGTVATQVGDLSVAASDLGADTGAVPWIAGLALALAPFAGGLSGVGGILKGIFYALKSISILKPGIFGGSAAAGAGGGAAGMFGGILRLAGGVGAILGVVEVMRTQSDTLDKEMTGVYDTLGNALGTTFGLISEGMGTWLAAASGDVQAIADQALALTQKFPGITQKIMEILQWGHEITHITGEGTVAGGGTFQAIKDSFDGGIRAIEQGIGGLGASLGNGKAAVVQDFRDFFTALDAIPLVGPDGKLTGFSELKNSIATSFTELTNEIAQGGPNVGQKITALHDLLATIPPGDPVLEPLRVQMQEQLDKIETEVRISNAPAAFRDLATQFSYAAQGIPESLKPLNQNVQAGLQDLATSIENRSPDVAAKVQNLLSMINSFPAGTMFDRYRQAAVTALQQMGVDVGVGADGVVTAAGAGLGKMPSVANVPMSGLQQKLAELTGQLPAAVVPGTDATVTAVGTGLAPVATAGDPAFSLLSTNVAASTAGIPAAITPGLTATTAQVGTSLAPVPTEGVAPFDQLGKDLASTTGQYPGQVQPGLDDAANQPGSQFKGVEQAGLTPWLNMSTAVISALNTMNISVARVMIAVAGIVVSSWSTIGAANAAGLSNVVSALTSTLAAARASKLAQEEVVRNSVSINILLIEMVQDVISSQRMLKTVQDNAAAARQAVIDAAGAASSAAASAAAAAASRASAAASTTPAFAPGIVAARLGGTFAPVPGGQMTLIAEAGKSERVEPLDRQGLSRRDRALIDYLSGTTGGGTNVNVQVLVGERELTDIIDTRIRESNNNTTRSVLSGRRRTAR